MKLFIIQPKLESALEQLKRELQDNPDVDIAIFPEGYLNEDIEEACRLAKQHNTILIGGHRRLNESPKDRAIVIDRTGAIVLDRVKYSQTSVAEVEGLRIGLILCDELVLQGIQNDGSTQLDLIVHPIGVGMFSEEQFQEWIDAARKTALATTAMIIGTSHADGTFRDSEVSIPIAYCIDSHGEIVYLAKNDVRSRLLDLRANKVTIPQEQKDMLRINKSGWDQVAGQFFEGPFDTLKYGSYAPTEEELGLLGPIADSVILEVGCGSGHTLEYLAKRGARELWGVDLSASQIKTAKEVVSGLETPVAFIESPMENIPGLPDAYFDQAISIFALGWTVDLSATLGNIYRSLKPGGIFVFSWEHPVHSVVEYADEELRFRRSYVQEGFEKHEAWRGAPIIMHNRKISTFINELIQAGFVIDKVIEESSIQENDASHSDKWYSSAKAQIIPATLIVKCHKQLTLTDSNDR